MDELPARVNRKAETVTLPPRKVKGWVHEMKVSLSDGESLQFETRHGNDARGKAVCATGAKRRYAMMSATSASRIRTKL